ncbi:MAG: hypothetical protein CL528_13390 [Aequorivita sp.]|jgi:hypothetical protein|nr:hypothetical protein [Aequorivita sp.]|tara:strand:+ start:10887 stop:13940 length:3054 start_codon:yes stop_codon:yes gene_type:complete
MRLVKIVKVASEKGGSRVARDPSRTKTVVRVENAGSIRGQTETQTVGFPTRGGVTTQRGVAVATYGDNLAGPRPKPIVADLTSSFKSSVKTQEKIDELKKQQLEQLSKKAEELSTKASSFLTTRKQVIARNIIQGAAEITTGAFITKSLIPDATERVITKKAAEGLQQLDRKIFKQKNIERQKLKELEKINTEFLALKSKEFEAREEDALEQHEQVQKEKEEFIEKAGTVVGGTITFTTQQEFDDFKQGIANIEFKEKQVQKEFAKIKQEADKVNPKIEQANKLVNELTTLEKQKRTDKDIALQAAFERGVEDAIVFGGIGALAGPPGIATGLVAGFGAGFGAQTVEVVAEKFLPEDTRFTRQQTITALGQGNILAGLLGEAVLPQDFEIRKPEAVSILGTGTELFIGAKLSQTFLKPRGKPIVDIEFTEVKGVTLEGEKVTLLVKTKGVARQKALFGETREPFVVAEKVDVFPITKKTGTKLDNLKAIVEGGEVTSINRTLDVAESKQFAKIVKEFGEPKASEGIGRFLTKTKKGRVDIDPFIETSVTQTKRVDPKTFVLEEKTVKGTRLKLLEADTTELTAFEIEKDVGVTIGSVKANQKIVLLTSESKKGIELKGFAKVSPKKVRFFDEAQGKDVVFKEIEFSDFPVRISGNLIEKKAVEQLGKKGGGIINKKNLGEIAEKGKGVFTKLKKIDVSKTTEKALGVGKAKGFSSGVIATEKAIEKAGTKAVFFGGAIQKVGLPVTVAPLRTGTASILSLKSKQKQEATPVVKESSIGVTIQSRKSSNIIVPKVKSSVITSGKFSLKQISGITTSFKAVDSLITKDKITPIIQPKLGTKQQSILNTQEITTTGTPSITLTPIITPPTTPILKIPKFPGDKKTKDKKPKKVPSYNAFVKEKGKFLKATKKPVTKNQALGRGATVVDQSTSAQFVIRKTGRKIPKPEKTDSVWSTLKRKFRVGKSGTIVEKNKNRIDSFGELQGITAKGLLTLKEQPLLRLRKSSPQRRAFVKSRTRFF